MECYRLHADVFQRLLARRPDLAEKVALALSERRAALQATRSPGMARSLSPDLNQVDLLHRIRSFFHL